MAHLWPQWDSGYVIDAYLDLCYSQHGGSGMHWSKKDVDEATWDVITKTRAALEERRKAESKRLKRSR